MRRLEALGGDFTLVSEELGERTFGDGGGTRIVVDPIDGSLNAKRGIPFFSFSLAVADGDDDGRRRLRLRLRLRHGRGMDGDARRRRAPERRARSARPARRTRSRSSPSRRRRTALRSPTRPRRWSAARTGCGSWARSRSRSATSPRAASTRVCSLKPARSVDIAAGQLLVRERGLAIDLFEDPPFEAAPLDLTGRSRVVAAGTTRAVPDARERAAPHRLLGLELLPLAQWRLLPAALPGPALARVLRAPLRHGRGERDLLPAADREGGAGLGRADTRRFRVRRQGEPLPDARQAAHRPRAGRRALLRPHRAARRARRSSVRCSGSSRPRSGATTSGSPSALARAARRAGTASSSGTRAGSPRRSMQLLREHGVALVIADRPQIHDFQTHELTTDWTFVRFHAGTRGRRGNYSETRAPRVGGERPLAWPVEALAVLQQRLGGLRACGTPRACATSLGAVPSIAHDARIAMRSCEALERGDRPRAAQARDGARHGARRSSSTGLTSPSRSR